MKTVVKMFKERFAPKVKDGTKRQTVRPIPKRNRPEPGDIFSGRQWSGAAYRSPQVKLREGIITEVEPITIEDDYITVNTNSEPCESFAIADGFDSFEDMRQWFATEHGLPFEGILIRWTPDPV